MLLLCVQYMTESFLEIQSTNGRLADPGEMKVQPRTLERQRTKHFHEVNMIS